MSYPESDISDLLEKADADVLYQNVDGIVQYAEDVNYEQILNDNINNTFRTLEDEQSLDFKQEMMFLHNETLIPSPTEQISLFPVFSSPSNICNEEYPGPHSFEVSIIPNGTKNPWVFSSVLNKVFIDMGAQFPVDFRVSSRPEEPIFIRVLPSFSTIQHSQELVYRCVQHEQPELNRNIPEHVRQHIIRSTNRSAQYLGDRNRNERLSIVFPLSYPQTGMDAVREMFVFVCKNSCPSGMNRKPVEIIFTLEKYDGTILGRRILNVRICSCPKRDKEKEEKDATNKGTNHGKKRKLEKVEKRPFETKDKNPLETKDKNLHSITIEVPGKHNVQQILKYCQDLMAGEIVRNPQNNENFVSCFKKIQGQLNQQC